MNKQKLSGIATALAGVIIARSGSFIAMEAKTALVLYSIGIAVAFIGLAVFAGSLKARVIKKIKVCPHCYFKNDASRRICIKCRKQLQTSENTQP